ncbi:MAG: NAD(P)-dependent oxidoreductase [Stappiaceae bacterium]
MSTEKIGFIGLGLMGSAMVQRLLDCKRDVVVLGNRSRPNIEAALAGGATEARSAKELAEASDVIMLCMGTSEQVESRMLGDAGVIAGLKAGSVVIDFGTSLPASTRKLGSLVEKAGGQMLDAPLGRTPSHAKDGLLNIMTAGDKVTFDKMKPVLDQLGENVFHLGALGSGHTIKLINNFFAMTTATAWSEAMGMADKAGIERQKLYDVVSAGPLHSGMMDFVSAYGLNNDPTKLAFSVNNAFKDVGYYRKMADDANFETIVSDGAFNALSSAVGDGMGDIMVPQLVDFFAGKRPPK